MRKPFQLKLFRDTSIKQKLTLVILCTCALGLSLACLAFEVYERASFRRALVSGLLQDTESLGLAIAPALTFDDPQFAAKMLATTEPERNITFVVLFSRDGNLFAEYRRRDLSPKITTPVWSGEGVQFQRQLRHRLAHHFLGGPQARLDCYRLRPLGSAVKDAGVS